MNNVEQVACESGGNMQTYLQVCLIYRYEILS